MSVLEPPDVAATAPIREPSGVPASVRRAVMLEHPTLAVAALQRGRVVQVNASWETLFALRPDISIESHVVTLFSNANAADRFEHALKVALAGSNTACLEQVLMRRDGKPFLAEVVVRVLEAYEVGKPLIADAVWQVRDITAERTLRRELRELEEYHRALSNYQSELTFVVDRRDCIAYASPSVETTLGYRTDAILGESIASILDPSTASESLEWLHGARRAIGDMKTDPDPGVERVLHLVDVRGDVRMLSCRARDCLDVPRVAGVVFHGREVNGKGELATESRIVPDPASIPSTDPADAARLRRRLFEVVGDGAEAPEARIARLLDAARTGTGSSLAVYWSSADGGRTFRSVALVGGDDAPAPNGSGDVETIVDGRLEFPVVRVGGVVGRCALFAGDGERKWTLAEVDFFASIALMISLGGDDRDALTGLFDRSPALRALATRIDDAASVDNVVAMVIDLDRFADVNASDGHAAGDAVLVATARALEDECRSDEAARNALVARIGSDQFLVVFTEVDARTTDAFAQRIVERIGGRALMPALDQPLGASVGIARFPADAGDGPSLLLAAELATVEAKARGRSQAFAFNQRMASNLRLQKELDREIADALGRNEFCIFYQPQVSLTTGRVIGLEALLRWQHPAWGLLLPDAFMTAAWHRGLIEAITKFVLTQVCEQIAIWRRSDERDELPVSVNVGGRQFHDRRLPATVAAALLKAGLPARLLVLEVTQQSLIGDDVATERVVKELSRLGVRLSIGDFGVGESSLKYLRDLVVSQIKLDRGLVGGLPDDAEGGVIVTAMIEIAKRLKYQVIAEGVETRAQLEHLRAIGCEAGQGFYFGAPLSSAEIGVYLEQNRRSPAH